MSGPMRGDHGSYSGLPPEIEINAKPAREAGPVLQYLSHLDLEIDRLDNALSQLIEKVNPILNPVASGEDGGDVSEKSQSDLAHSLEAKCERVHLTASILADVTRRIEL